MDLKRQMLYLHGVMETVKIVDFSHELAVYFKKLNEEWLTKFFVVEPIDALVLEHPYEQIIVKGGEVIFALLEGQVVGTCALKNHGEGRFELTKMAVTQDAQGKQIGKQLGLGIIEKARQKNATSLFLESNHQLIPALQLYEKLGFYKTNPPFEQSDYSRADTYMELNLTVLNSSRDE